MIRLETGATKTWAVLLVSGRAAGVRLMGAGSLAEVRKRFG